jgi:DNA-binding response OmpR family regulator/anti-sigma regulatory factor (Ser/Thr protein kinase)
MQARILVIDDDPVASASASALLTENGCIVEAARDGATGIARAEAITPDLIVSETALPDLDGYRVLDSVRSHPRLRSVPFVFLTTSTASGARLAAIRAGADEYIVKPCESEVLVSSIQACLLRAQRLRAASFQSRGEMAVGFSEFCLRPLRGSLGLLQILRDYGPSLRSQDLRGTASEVLKVTRQVLRRVERLSATLKLEGLLRETPEDSCAISTGDLATAAQELARLADRSDDCRVDFDELILPYRAWQLRIILAELMNNALDYSRPGTRIDVSLRPREDRIAIEVRDAGRGMSAERIADILTAQVPAATLPPEPLLTGLQLCRVIVTKLNGEMRIHSIPGNCAGVVVTLPL